MIEVNYAIVLLCAILAMGVGAIWYGPLFGKKWMWILNVDPTDTAKMKEMQKGMMPTYVVQFLLILFQVYVLFHYVKGAEGEMSAMSNVIWIWAGFIMPTIATTVLWNGESRDRAWARFSIQAGYQLVMFLIFGYVIGMWG